MKERIDHSKSHRPSEPAEVPHLSGEFDVVSLSFSGTDGKNQLPNHASTQRLRQGKLIQLQRLHGNQFVRRFLKSRLPVGHSPREMVSRLVEYNEDVVGGRFTDPEQARGVLPFTEDGWNGGEIGRRLSQLDSATARDDNVRCVQTSFLVALIQRGPDAVEEMIQRYISRYRAGIGQATTPPRIKRWYRRSIRNLTPLLPKFDSKTLQYEDLSTLLTEMYDIYGAGGTSLRSEISMLRREGYTSTVINKSNVTQEEAAEEASNLEPGEFLSCAVDATREGTGPIGHNVHIGRYPDTSRLYFYDPWPIRGDQLVDTDEDLNAIQHYFVNPLEEEGEESREEEEGPTIEMFEMRTFDVRAKFSPPAEESE